MLQAVKLRLLLSILFELFVDDYDALHERFCAIV